MEDVVREPVELIDEDLDEVAGGFLNINNVALALGVGQENVASVAFLNVNTGVGAIVER